MKKTIFFCLAVIAVALWVTSADFIISSFLFGLTLTGTVRIIPRIGSYIVFLFIYYNAWHGNIKFTRRNEIGYRY